MTTEEIKIELQRIALERDVMLEEFVTLNRSLEPQLRDLGANHTADRVMAQLGKFDELEARVKSLIPKDPTELLATLLQNWRART